MKEKGFRFSENFFQNYCKFVSKVLKTFQISSDCHIKACRSLKRRAILKILSTIFRRTYALSVRFEMEPLKKAFPSVKENQLEFCRNHAETLKEASIRFCLFNESHFSNICTL